MSARLAEIRDRTAWFRESRFGMFIHWGLYAIPARGEWVRSKETIAFDEYSAYALEFNPRKGGPREWARAARQAGMRYAVMTAKHHDGYCLFESQLTGFTSAAGPSRRDFVGEFVESCRAEGLRVGLYYSLMDWHHPEYPHYGDAHHPMRDDESWRDRQHRVDQYVEYLHGQVRELCSNYGRIDILWFDFSYEEMAGERWRATRLMEMVRALQPEVIVDNRLEASGDSRMSSLLSGRISAHAGDFVSPEQIIPPHRVIDRNGDWVPWEACITMNDHWGYCASDRNWKPASLIVRKLVECTSKGGNLLLNVGPDVEGRLPDESLQVLSEIGVWMERNAESIYGCGPVELPKPEWGYYTGNDRNLYAHVFDEQIGPLALPLNPQTVARIRLLRDGSEVRKVSNWATSTWTDHTFMSLGMDELSHTPLPDRIDTVVVLDRHSG